MSERDEIHAVLLTLPGDTLLMPNAAIAEVLSTERLRPVTGGVPWLAGNLPYEDRLLRVIRFEALNGAAKPPEARRLRLAILNGMTGRLATGQYAVLCQGHPNLVMLNREALKHEARLSTDRDELVLSRVRIGNTSAVIPNLELIETEIAKLDARGAR